MFKLRQTTKNALSEPKVVVCVYRLHLPVPLCDYINMSLIDK